MKKLALSLLFFLTACASNPTGLARPVAMPDLPPSLSVKAEQLPPLTDPSMGAAHIDGAETDKTYNKVAWQLNDIIDAWNCVKVSLAEKKDPIECFKESVNN